MKKIATIACALALASGMFAAVPAFARQGNGQGNGQGTGICQGVCDGTGQGYGRGNGNGTGQGAGQGQGANFVDADNDGVCDNFANKPSKAMGTGRGMHFGSHGLCRK
mgnify:CR=1 FL=1